MEVVLSLYIRVQNYIPSMTDWEREMIRGTRENGWARAGGPRRTNRSLEEYASLEYPKESPAWLLGSAERTHAPSSAPFGTPTAIAAVPPTRRGLRGKSDG